jgi:putative endonuclease
MPYFFYIIQSKLLDKYYVGHTHDLEGRLRRHNSNHKGFTRRANDWTFVLTKSYPTKEAAYKREREVKNWKSRKLIEKLIEKERI